mgnify:CR=1 FL=1
MESIFAVANWWNNVKGPLADAGINTLIGIAVVFAVLLFISYVISLFRYISVFEKKIAAKKAGKTAQEEQIAIEDVSDAEEGASETDDLELIAVITAAIQVYEEAQGNAVAGDLVVRSIRKIDKAKWQRA